MEQKEFDTFREWFEANLADYAEDIAGHGADAGFPHITYTTDTVRLYDWYEEEIWEHARRNAADMGYRNIMDMIASFSRQDMLGHPMMFKNLMVWYMAEEISRELAPSWLVDRLEGLD